MQQQRTGLKVGVFTVVMIVIAAALVVTFGKFKFGSGQEYTAEFSSVSRLKTGQDVRISGVTVGSVKDIAIAGDHVNVTFDVNDRYQLYTSTRAVIRYEDLVGNRFLEIASGPGDLRTLPPGGTIPRSHTQPALDLDALLGGLRPVLKGLDGGKVNAVSNAVIELLQGDGGPLADLLSSTGSLTQTLAARDQLIGDVITNLNTVLGTVGDKSSQLDTSIDQLQQLIGTLSKGRDPISGALEPLASAQTELTDLLQTSRRPLQGVIENVRPLATTLDDRKADVNAVVDRMPENYARLASLGSYGSFFNIFFCQIKFKLNGPAGSDIIIPAAAPVDPNRGRCAFTK
ncbi:MCE family protein [Mycolicibacterium obuense]|uniref:Mce related protein n=1 Tax=Mycolicibacterium obuense TaxID=1807 RepID=A0A0J6WE64_9MYCO|nr:MCE family protein [Mycolicibacterium obuense]KMO80027.1 mce related protein [Mycolicibacterium obuense]